VLFVGQPLNGNKQEVSGMSRFVEWLRFIRWPRCSTSHCVNHRVYDGACACWWNGYDEGERRAYRDVLEDYNVTPKSIGNDWLAETSCSSDNPSAETNDDVC
jgi:hypothetical protein